MGQTVGMISAGVAILVTLVKLISVLNTNIEYSKQSRKEIEILFSKIKREEIERIEEDKKILAEIRKAEKEWQRNNKQIEVNLAEIKTALEYIKQAVSK